MAPRVQRSQRRNPYDEENDREVRAIEDAYEQEAKEAHNFGSFEEALKIDEHDLDGANQAQAESFYRVAKGLELAISRRDELKTELQRAEAEADADIRHALEVEGEKITEAAVKNRVVLHKSVIRLQNLVHAANYDVGKGAALKDAFKQRGYALGNMTDLYITRYRAAESTGDRRVRDADADFARKSMAEQRTRGGR